MFLIVVAASQVECGLSIHNVNPVCTAVTWSLRIESRTGHAGLVHISEFVKESWIQQTYLFGPGLREMHQGGRSYNGQGARECLEDMENSKLVW